MYVTALRWLFGIRISDKGKLYILTIFSKTLAKNQKTGAIIEQINKHKGSFI